MSPALSPLDSRNMLHFGNRSVKICLRLSLVGDVLRETVLSQRIVFQMPVQMSYSVVLVVTVPPGKRATSVRCGLTDLPRPRTGSIVQSWPRTSFWNQRPSPCEHPEERRPRFGSRHSRSQSERMRPRLRRFFTKPRSPTLSLLSGSWALPLKSLLSFALIRSFSSQ